ncbi:MAG: LamG-like jellyroll fold domain-containing protein [Elusimicrobiota bacterium]
MDPKADAKPLPRFVGFFIILIGIGLAGMTRVHPERLNADAWVGFAVGALFVLGGAAVLAAPPPGAPPESAGALSSALGASIWTVFAAIMFWWAFYAKGGSTRVSFGPLSFLSRGRLHWLGRVPIALAGAMCALASFFVWRSTLDAAERARPGSRAPLAFLLIGALGWASFKALRPEPPPAFGAPVVEAALTGDLSATGAGAPEAHGKVAAGAEGTSFGGGADWLDYALPRAARLDGGGALELVARAERRQGPARSPAETLAAAGPFVIDSYPGRDSWRVNASAGDCVVNSEELPYGRWTKIALAYDAWSGRAALFIDGRREAQTSCLGPLPPERGETLRLGTWHGAYQAFTGSLRAVRIYPRAGSL